MICFQDGCEAVGLVALLEVVFFTEAFLAPAALDVFDSGAAGAGTGEGDAEVFEDMVGRKNMRWDGVSGGQEQS